MPPLYYVLVWNLTRSSLDNLFSPVLSEATAWPLSHHPYAKREGWRPYKISRTIGSSSRFLRVVTSHSLTKTWNSNGPFQKGNCPYQVYSSLSYIASSFRIISWVGGVRGQTAWKLAGIWVDAALTFKSLSLANSAAQEWAAIKAKQKSNWVFWMFWSCLEWEARWFLLPCGDKVTGISVRLIDRNAIL